MTTSADPTLDLLKRLKDKSLWKIVPNVPVFRAHRRKDKKTQAVEVVDVPRLKRIVENTRRLRESGVVPRITIGHIEDDLPEDQQPDIVGFADNWRFGTFGPESKPCILVDNYYDLADLEKLYHPDGRAIYPYRSAEFFPPRDEITGLALLKRDPELDLGLVLYSRSDGMLSYNFGDHMPNDMMNDPAKAPKAAPTPPMNPGAGGDDPDYKKFLDHLTRHPVLKYVCSKYEQDPGYLSSTDAALPGEGNDDDKKKDEDKRREDEEKKNMQRSTEAIHYRRLEEQVAQLQRDRDTQALNYARADARRRVSGLLAEGFLIKDSAKEVEAMTKMASDTQRQARENEIRENYNRAPVGGSFLHIANLDGTPDSREAQEVTSYQRDQAVSLASREGIDFDEALAKVRKKAQ